MGLAAVEGNGMKKFLVLSCVLIITLVFARAGDSQNAPDKATVIVAVGAAGEDEFGTDFQKSAQLWIDACKKGGANCIAIGLDPTNATTDLERLKQTLSAEPRESANELWLVLLGHGTFDGKVAKVNLRGPDISTDDLSAWLQPFKRPLAVID